MNVLENLNPDQRDSVLHIHGPLLILAGAGSGKTRVITHRIAHLIEARHAEPFHVFAVTFTNKAAEEMRNRVVRMIGPAAKSVFIKTFHSAGVYILRNFGEKIGIARSFTIYDQSDQESVIKEILIGMRLDPKKVRPGMIASKISEIKDKAELMQGADIRQLAPDYHAFNFHEIYQEYHRMLRERNALDFNDLLIKTVELFNSSPETLAALQERWRFFMIDEYQDTNFAQYLIAKNLAKRSRNICVVGDDDQSIYSWRGADIRNILNFESDYPEAKVITLGCNYRSAKPILDAASSVIRNNKMRKEKTLVPQKTDGEPVLWVQANNEYGEAEYVINSIMSLKRRERLTNSDFSIFYRTNAQSRIFEDLLRKENIPYRVVGGLRFYDRKEIKDMLAYLKFIANPLDLVSLLRIINTPPRGIGRATFEKIRETAMQNGITEWAVIRENRLTGKASKGLNDFAALIASLQETAEGVPGETALPQFIEKVFTLSGYKKSLEDEDSVESGGRIDNVQELINGAYAFDMANPGSALDEFLQEVSLYSSEENPDDPEDKKHAVTLMTIHNAKGLEFPVVFLTGMEEEIFPHKLSADTEEGIEEERRLCYVGITRAKERVFLTNAELRRTYSGVYRRDPSRFLFELLDCIAQREFYYSEAYAHPGGFYRDFTIPSRRPIDKRSDEDYHEDDTAPVNEDGDELERPGSRFSVSDTVVHPKYGMGRVVKIEGSGDNLKLTIFFGSGMKVFLEKYTPLEKK